MPFQHFLTVIVSICMHIYILGYVLRDPISFSVTWLLNSFRLQPARYVQTILVRQRHCIPLKIWQTVSPIEVFFFLLNLLLSTMPSNAVKCVVHRNCMGIQRSCYFFWLVSSMSPLLSHLNILLSACWSAKGLEVAPSLECIPKSKMRIWYWQLVARKPESILRKST